MKELDEILKVLIPEHELNVVKRQEIEYMIDEILKPHPNHPTFEIDLIEKEIRIAQVETLDTVNILNWKEEIKEQNLIKKPKCLYVSSLNINNLRRRLKKISKEMAKFPFIKEEINLSLHKDRKIKVLKGKN